MKQFAFRILTLIAIMLWSCSDNDNLLTGEPELPAETKGSVFSIVNADGEKVSEFSHNFGKYFLDINVDGEWEIESDATFLAPAVKKGIGPKRVPLIVGSNWAEQRAGGITLRTSQPISRGGDGMSAYVSATQEGNPNLDEVKSLFSSNRGAGYSYTPNTNFTLGTNIEVFNMKNLDSLQRSGNYLLYVDDYIAHVEESILTASSDHELSSKLAVSASLDFGYSNFSINVSGHFDGGKEESETSEYAVKRVKSYMFSREINWANLLSIAASSKEKDSQVFSPGFIYLRNKFLTSVKSASTQGEKNVACKEFISKVGPTFIAKGVMGCTLDYYIKASKTVLKEGMTVGGALELKFAESIKVEGEGEYTAEEKNITKNTEASIVVRGGDVKKVSIITTGGALANEEFIAWQQSVTPLQSVLVDMRLEPIYYLIEDDDARQILRDYIESVLKSN